mmetsp:Transcript_15851/g.22666  ORF Transcript_15851/g.22666 Transcript_15851/m.22666 type:complete len:104 (-) Transcript_15851:17-328(-)
MFGLSKDQRKILPHQIMVRFTGLFWEEGQVPLASSLLLSLDASMILIIVNHVAIKQFLTPKKKFLGKNWTGYSLWNFERFVRTNNNWGTTDNGHEYEYSYRAL